MKDKDFRIWLEWILSILALEREISKLEEKLNRRI